jgi:hypothetical protein
MASILGSLVTGLRPGWGRQFCGRQIRHGENAMSLIPDLTKRVALVTGGSRGIGRAIALALAETRADVVINYHGRADLAQEVVQAVRAQGRRAITIAADVSQGAAVEALVRQAHAELGLSCCRKAGSDSLLVQGDLGGIVIGEGRPRHDESPGHLVTFAIPGRDHGRTKRLAMAGNDIWRGARLLSALWRAIAFAS